MRRWNPGPTWSASCSSRRARAISAWRPRACWASASRAAPARSRSRSTPPTIPCSPSSRRCKPDMLQLHGKETPERVVQVRTRFGLPVMKALPIAERADLSPIREYAQVADRLLFDARPPKEATRPGGLGRPLRLDAARRHRPGRALHAVGRARCRQCGGGAAHHPRARRRRVLRRRKRARRQGPRARSANSSAPRAQAKSRYSSARPTS